jgi:hypothetical protein
MKTIRFLISSTHRYVLWVLLTGLYACTPSLSENNPDSIPLYSMPDDGLAEVAKYSYSRNHAGSTLRGSATLIVSRDYLSEPAGVATGEPKQRMPVVKVTMMKTLPSMSWDKRENLTMFCRNDLRPVRLAMTAEEWSGNNYLEWVARGDEVSLLGRPIMDENGRLTTQVAVKAGYYLYEELPVLVRALAKNDQPLTLRMIAPQTADLLPHAQEVQVEVARGGKEKISTEAGSFSTVVVTVTPAASSTYFPEPEKFWIDEQRHFIVRAERNEVDAGSGGHAVVCRAVYELMNYRRVAYSQMVTPPATNSLDDGSSRADLDAQQRLVLNWDSTKREQATANPAVIAN